MRRWRNLALAGLALTIAGCASTAGPARRGALTPQAVSGPPLAEQVAPRSNLDRRQYFDQRRKRYYFYDPARRAYYWDDGTPKG